jgi:O-antigen ligase
MSASPAILVLGVLGALAIFFLALQRPITALAVWLIISTVLSEYILFPNAATLHVHLSRVLLTALIVGLTFGWAPRARRVNTSVLPATLIVILTIWTVFSAVWTGTFFRADGTRNLSVFITGFLVPGMVLYLSSYFPVSLKDLRSVCMLLFGLLGYMIFTAFCEHFHINALIFPPYILDPSIGIHAERARGPIVNAAENGGMIAVLLFVGVHTVLYGFNGAMRWLSSFGLLALGALALFFTETRGTWLAFAGGLAVMLLHRQCRAVVMVLGGIGAAGLAVFVVTSGVSVGTIAMKNPLPTRSDNTSDTVDFRMNLYRESIQPFQEHPLVGWGLGTFTNEDYLFDAYGGSSTISTAVLHDTLVAITLESGIVGGVLYVAFLCSTVIPLFRLRGFSQSFETRDFYIVCVASIAAFVINGLFVDIRYFAHQNALICFLAGLGLGLSPGARPRQPTGYRIRAAAARRHLR